MSANSLTLKPGRVLAPLLAGLLLALPAAPTWAQGTLSTLFVNGPTANRINLVVLSEGYRTNELAKFLVDATNAVNSFFSTPPYQEYRPYFNAYAISVASVQSGSDHYTPTVSLVNTYFNSSFDSFGLQRLLTIPPNDHDSDASHGQGKVDALLQALMPEYDLVMMLVNDSMYGGSGGQVLITSLNVSSPEIGVHESGHTFGGLTDEYSSAYPGWVMKEYPNATAQTSRSLIKWNTWIASSTPLPTPATAQYTSSIGLFQGAEYQTTGWYRPKFDCKMNHLGIPFCEVCGEQLVKSIYKTISPIDAHQPLASNLVAAAADTLSFRVTPLQPASHALRIQWWTNGVAVPGGTNLAFTLFAGDCQYGTNRVQVQVRDATSLVRSDPAGALSRVFTWNLSVAPPGLQLTSLAHFDDGRFTFYVTGTAPNGFVIEASSNFLNWASLYTRTNPLIGSQFYLTNTGIQNVPSRFYRALSR